MRLTPWLATFPLAALCALSGCASGPSAETEAAVSAALASAEKSSSSSDSRASAASAAENAKREERSAAPAVARGAASSSGAQGGSSDVVAQLNEATRELAALRVANAKLRAERGSSAPAPASASASAARPSPAEEKLNQTLRSYTQFKQELTTVIADIDKLRSENVALAAQLKEADAKAQRATGDVAKLEKDLRAERDARLEAERNVASLRDQLRAVARAVNASGVPLDASGTARAGGR